MKYIITIFIFLILGVHIYISIQSNIPKMQYDRDEVAWFYHTKFLDLALEGNLTDPFWQGLEAYDHPPLSKYIYGIYLKLYFGDYSYTRRALVEKYGDWYHLLVPDIRTTEFVPFIDRMRTLNIPIIAGILFFLLLCIYKLTNSLAFAVVQTLWFVHTDKVMLMLLRAVSGAHYLLLLCIAIGVFFAYLHKRSYIMLLLSAVLGVLSMSSKLNGSIYFIIISVYLLLDKYIHRVKWKNFFISLGVVFGIGFFTWFVINPSLYPAPFEKSYRYYLMRQSIMVYQMHEPQNTMSILSDAPAKFRAAGYAALSPSWINQCKPLSIEFIMMTVLFVLGIWFLVKKSIEIDTYALFTLIAWGIIMNYVLFFSPFAWDRYYLPLNIITLIVCSYGLGTIIQKIIQYRNSFRIQL